MIDIESHFPARAGNIGSALFHYCAAAVLKGEGRNTAGIRFVVVDDSTILDLNTRFLGHRYPTDVITFPLESSRERLEAEIYISIETARRQAAEYRVSLREEVARLAIHGVLHACGHDDVKPASRRRMQGKENQYLERYLRRTRVKH